MQGWKVWRGLGIGPGSGAMGSGPKDGGMDGPGRVEREVGATVMTGEKDDVWAMVRWEEQYVW